MPARKQFQSTFKVKPELKRLLEEARNKELSDDDLSAQRISFAFGNAPADSKITKASMERASRSIRLKR